MEQVVVFSKATGRVRRVVDPSGPVKAPHHANLHPGEGHLIRVKRGDRFLDSLHGWQAEVAAAIKKRPHPLHPVTKAHVDSIAPHATVVPDRYVVVSPGGTILRHVYADPACGDTVPDGILVQHDSADARWTYADGVFTAPLVQTKAGPKPLA